MLEYALELAGMGLPVHPLHTPVGGGRCSCGRKSCGSVGKHPRTMSGVKDASTDPGQIKKWWSMWPDANIGFATGGSSRIVVLDVDCNHAAGKYGDESLNALEERHGPLPDTWLCLTGGGGLHYYFFYDGDGVKNDVEFLPGLDVRTTGGYVVAPPSLHASGRRYEWEGAHEPWDTPIAPLPDWLRDIIIRGKEGSTGHGERLEIPDTVAEGGRNRTMFRLAASLRARGLTEPAILAAIWEENQKRCAPPQDRKEIETICGSVGRYKRGSGVDRLQAAAIAEEKVERASEGDFETLTDPEVLTAALRLPDPIEREMKLAELRGRAKELKRARDFERVLKAHQEALQKERAREAAAQEPEDIDLPDCPLPGLKCFGWNVDVKGVTRVSTEFFGEVERACSHPVIITERLTNIDTGGERVKLAFYRDKRWKDIIVDKSTIASRQKVIELADAGLQVNSENARFLIQYLHDLEAQNAYRISRKRCVSRLGWADNGRGGMEFVPYVVDVQYDGDPKYAAFFGAVRPSGDYRRWKERILEAREQSTVLRAALAASFASPLMWPLGAQVFFLHLWGGTEVGKAQPLDTKIVTPDGWKPMGDLRVGDMVIGGDGRPHEVVGVYPQGEKEVFELTFSDGRKTRCCKEHLWNVTTRTRREHGCGYVTISLEEMLERPIKDKKGYTYRVPLCRPVEYSSDGELPIAPYLLGALVGDGCLTLKQNPANRHTALYFNNSEYDVIGRVMNELNKIGAVMRFNPATTNQFSITHCGALKEAIVSLGLNVKSTDRAIPEAYLRATVADRRALLAGLLDTDGHVTEKGSLNYSTSSRQLAADVCELARGLGYKATLSAGRGAERIVRISSDGDVFLSRKHEARMERAKQGRNRAEDLESVALVSVEPVGVEPCQCIMVDSADHTYLCDDFIVTHNTVAQMAAMSVWGDPDLGALLRSYNATYVGMERMAAFCHSIPLALDEQQTVRNNRYFNMDTLIYNLCEGQGKGRGTKSGSIENMATWRLCVLSSGEGPLTDERSGGGGKNRVIELYCKDKLFEDAASMADFVKGHYGYAGREFIKAMSEPGVIEEAKSIRDACRKLFLGIGHGTEKQAASAAMLAVGDYFSSVCVFRVDPGTAIQGTRAFCYALAEYLTDTAEVSQVERAYRWVCDWIAANPGQFERQQPGGIPYHDDRNKLWGKQTDAGYAVIASVMDEAMEQAGFIMAACKEGFAERGYIIPGNSRKTKQLRIGRDRPWCYELVVPKLAPGETDESGDDTDDPWKNEQKMIPFLRG